MRPSQPSLPTSCAFVVQFRDQLVHESVSWEGRIEHLVSGEVLRFHSPEELLSFFTRWTDTGETGGAVPGCGNRAAVYGSLGLPSVLAAADPRNP